MPSPQSEKLTPAHVANYILWLARKFGIKDMTSLKLINLVYISYAWHLYAFGEEMFSERPQAWKFGPAFPSLYHAIKISGNEPIDGYVAISDLGQEGREDVNVFPFVRDDDDDILSSVVNAFYAHKDKTGEELREMTHRESGAWQAAYADGLYSEINDKELIRSGARVGVEKYLKDAEFAS